MNWQMPLAAESALRRLAWGKSALWRVKARKAEIKPTETEFSVQEEARNRRTQRGGRGQGVLLSIIYGLLKVLKHMMAGLSTEREIKRMKGQIAVQRGKLLAYEVLCTKDWLCRTKGVTDTDPASSLCRFISAGSKSEFRLPSAWHLTRAQRSLIIEWNESSFFLELCADGLKWICHSEMRDVLVYQDCWTAWQQKRAIIRKHPGINAVTIYSLHQDN